MENTENSHIKKCNVYPYIDIDIDSNYAVLISMSKLFLFPIGSTSPINIATFKLETSVHWHPSLIEIVSAG